MGLGHGTDEDCANVRYVCACVSRRAAHIVSAGIACLIDRMALSRITVGVDGSVYRFHPHFHDLMKAKVSELVSEGEVSTYFTLPLFKTDTTYFLFDSD